MRLRAADLYQAAEDCRNQASVSAQYRQQSGFWRILILTGVSELYKALLRTNSIGYLNGIEMFLSEVAALSTTVDVAEKYLKELADELSHEMQLYKWCLDETGMMFVRDNWRPPEM
ncbi:hypothetical protein VTJ49DRAFT_917 [Mycothermus thermophilus]|uniref:Uncharacterized protein n=1 Tax=Humicola insolens TaxID=85995 RepID=A0ABR3VDP7_HUMIN